MAIQNRTDVNVFDQDLENAYELACQYLNISRARLYMIGANAVLTGEVEIHGDMLPKHNSSVTSPSWAKTFDPEWINISPEMVEEIEERKEEIRGKIKELNELIEKFT